MHGVVLRYDHNHVGYFAMQVLQPFLIVFVHRCDGASLHIPNRIITLLFKEQEKAEIDLAKLQYQRPKHPSVIEDIVGAYHMTGWGVALYGMGLASESVLRNGIDVIIIDDPHRIRFFDAYFSCLHKFEDASEEEAEEGEEMES